MNLQNASNIMYKIHFRPHFVRQYKKLSKVLQEEVRERIELLREDPKHAYLKTHPLRGRLHGSWSCSVNYEYRIVFEFEPENYIVLLAVGNHNVYES